MKWFFISIFILYWFLLPSEVFQSFDNYTIINLLPIVYRISILVTIIFAVNLLIKTTTKEEIISAVYLLISPLTLLKINIKSFLITAYLTLDLVDNLNSELKQRKQSKQQSQKIIPFIGVWLEKSIQANLENIYIEKLNSPNLFQWFIPVSLIFCYIAILN
jgi:hypothetical protein